MDWRMFATVFGTVFLAELGDKTQLATMVFAARTPGGRWTVFAAAAAALVLSTALGVLAGGIVNKLVDPRWLTRAAGAAFVLLGAWMLWRS
ncbi:MAG: TMEM165/GDT1 family protein [Myxococcales bacterium]|nr:TMEM165/GDT1 family protein [Myxococcales bacterium]